MYYVSLRLTNAFLSGLSVPLFYLILRAVGSGPGASWLGACFLCADLLWLAAGREIGVWGVLQFLACLAVLQIALFDRYQSLTALICEGTLLGMLLATDSRGAAILAVAVIQQFRFPGWPGRVGILCALSTAV